MESFVIPCGISNVQRNMIDDFFASNKNIKSSLDMALRGGNIAMRMAVISVISEGTGLSESYVTNNLILIMQ